MSGDTVGTVGGKKVCRCCDVGVWVLHIFGVDAYVIAYHYISIACTLEICNNSDAQVMPENTS